MRYANDQGTPRPSFVSLARYTSPMPPSPILAVTAYGPREVPASRGITQHDGVVQAVIAGHVHRSRTHHDDQGGLWSYLDPTASACSSARLAFSMFSIA